MSVIWFGEAPPHDPIYGIRRKNIVPRLTRNDWQTKAVGRMSSDRFLYVMVKRGEQRINGKKTKRYFVRVHLGAPIDNYFNADFDKLMDALAYANGRDMGAIQLATDPALPEEYPDNQGPDYFITGFVGERGKRRPTFTIRLPGAIDDDKG